VEWVGAGMLLPVEWAEYKQDWAFLLAFSPFSLLFQGGPFCEKIVRSRKIAFFYASRAFYERNNALPIFSGQA
jgi:hypothetical protein